MYLLRNGAGGSHQRPPPALLRAATGTATSGAARAVVYLSYSLYLPPPARVPAPRTKPRRYVLCPGHDKSSRNGRLLHGRLGGGRASGYLRERERRLRARAAAPRRGAAVGGGLLGAKPERTKTCIYAHARQLLAAIVSPLVVVTRHHPLLLRECVLSGTATYGAARTVVYILFPILPPGGASKPRMKRCADGSGGGGRSSFEVSVPQQRGHEQNESGHFVHLPRTT